MKDFKKLIREAHLGNPLNEEDRATRVDKMLSGKYEDEDYKDSERYACYIWSKGRIPRV